MTWKKLWHDIKCLTELLGGVRKDFRLSFQKNFPKKIWATKEAAHSSTSTAPATRPPAKWMTLASQHPLVTGCQLVPPEKAQSVAQLRCPQKQQEQLKYGFCLASTRISHKYISMVGPSSSLDLWLHRNLENVVVSFPAFAVLDSPLQGRWNEAECQSSVYTSHHIILNEGREEGGWVEKRAFIRHLLYTR